MEQGVYVDKGHDIHFSPKSGFELSAVAVAIAMGIGKTIEDSAKAISLDTKEGA